MALDAGDKQSQPLSLGPHTMLKEGAGPAGELLPSVGWDEAGRRLLLIEALSDGLAASFRADVAKDGSWSLLLPQPWPYEGYAKGAAWGWVRLACRDGPGAKEAWRARLRFAAAVLAAWVSRLPPPPHRGGRLACLPLPAVCAGEGGGGRHREERHVQRRDGEE